MTTLDNERGAIKDLLVSEGLPNTTSAQVVLEAAEQIMLATMKKSARQEADADQTTALFFCGMLVVGVIYIVAALVRMRNPKSRSNIGLSKKRRSGVDDPGAARPCDDDGVPELPDPEQGQMQRKWEGDGDETESDPDPEETDKAAESRILTGNFGGF